MSWYLKYRPQKIADLDITEVRESLLQMMQQGKIPQTLLFAGPRGTGKTSTSRIIGAMLNDSANRKVVDQLFFQQKNPSKPLQEPDPETDFATRVFQGRSYVVQEMDAASNRGIDDIRQLKERINLPPQEGMMAVYILDEVHMLTTEAFNALLKILEEPPPHVVFILATTELHKVPPTIVSRCTTVSFRKANIEELVERLKKVLDAEKIKYDPQALSELAIRADGSFRDAVKLAEAAASQGQLSLDQVKAVIGGSALIQVEHLVNAVLAKDQAQVSQIFVELRQQNLDQTYFLQTLYDYLHQSLLASLGVVDMEPAVVKKVSEFLLDQLLRADLDQETPIPFLPLELLLLKIIEKAQGQNSGSRQSKTDADQNTQNVSGSKKNQDSENKTESVRDLGSINTSGNKRDGQSTQTQTAKKSTVATSSKTNPALADKDSSEDDPDSVLAVVNQSALSLSSKICQQWQQLVRAVETHNLTLAALLRSSKPQSGENGTADVAVYYRFHQEQLQQPKHRAIIEQCSREIIGDDIHFNFVLVDAPNKAELLDFEPPQDDLEVLAKEALL